MPSTSMCSQPMDRGIVWKYAFASTKPGNSGFSTMPRLDGKTVETPIGFRSTIARVERRPSAMPPCHQVQLRTRITPSRKYDTGYSIPGVSGFWQ